MFIVSAPMTDELRTDLCFGSCFVGTEILVDCFILEMLEDVQNIFGVGNHKWAQYLTFQSFDLDQLSLRVATALLCVPLCSAIVDRYTCKKFLALGFLLKEIFVRYEKWNAQFKPK